MLVLQGAVKALIEIQPAGNIAFRGMADQLEEKTVDLVSSSQRFAIQKVENKLEELYSVVEYIDGRRLGPAFRFLQEHRMEDAEGKLLGYPRAADAGSCRLRARLAAPCERLAHCALL